MLAGRLGNWLERGRDEWTSWPKKSKGLGAARTSQDRMQRFVALHLEDRGEATEGKGEARQESCG